MPDVEEHQEYNEAALQLSPVLYLQIIIRPFMMITCTHTSTVYTWQHEFLPLLQLCLMITTKCSYSLYYCNFYEMLPVIPLNTAMSHSYTLACFRKLFLLLLLTALSLHLTCRKSCKGTHTHNLVNFSQRMCTHVELSKVRKSTQRTHGKANLEVAPWSFTLSTFSSICINTRYQL